jgi:hypothetical protein
MCCWLSLEAVSSAEVGVNVGPGGRVALELLAELSDVHINRAVAVGHSVAPDVKVDLLACQYLVRRAGEESEQLELLAGEADAAAADECLQPTVVDFELAGSRATGE